MRCQFKYNDGGRAQAGYKGNAGDCVCRAITIASGKPYAEIYEALANGNATQRTTKNTMRSKSSMRKAGVKTASQGIHTNRKWFKDYMISLGFEWVSCMGIGTGCKVHLRGDELPMGKLVAMLSKHSVAVIDRVINDTYDPSREGNRCVYGYWILKG